MYYISQGSLLASLRMFSNSNMEERGRRGKEEDTGGSRSSKQVAESTPSSSAPTPAARGGGEDAEAAGGGDEDEQLDVCSERFDPLLALYSPAAPRSLPYPNMKCFNNVAQYESFLRGGPGRAKAQNVERRQRKAMKGVADPERIERLRQLMVKNPTTAGGDSEEGGEASGSSSTAAPRRGQKKIKNVLTRMLLCKGSPLGELQRCVEEKIRVKVHIRTFKGLRGICSGFVVAFDKFWNLAMVDVDETYREPLLGEALYHEKALTVSQLFEKLKLQENPEEGSEQARKHTGKGKTSIPQPETSKQTRERDAKSRDPRLSKSTGRVKDNEPGPTVKAQAPETSQKAQKKSAHPYGKVHTRHINQLFVRGENVLLINPQPL